MRAMRADVKDCPRRPTRQPKESAGNADAATAKPHGGSETLVRRRTPPQAKAADQTDDLLFPTEEELRAIKAHGQGHREISPA